MASAVAAPSFGRFFLPGPTDVHPEVLAAMALPMIPHRGKQMTEMLTGMAGPLQRIFRTSHRVLIGTCSATGNISPVLFSPFGSNGWAINVSSRRKTRYPCPPGTVGGA